MSYLPDDYIMDYSKRIYTTITVIFYNNYGDETGQHYLDISYLQLDSETITDVEVVNCPDKFIENNDFYVEDIEFSIRYELNCKIEGPLNFIS